MPPTITHEIPFTEQQHLPLLGHSVIDHDIGLLPNYQTVLNKLFIVSDAWDFLL